ncbi:MAG TPA: HlyC/CorC family transporter [Bacteroidetes bacterium]|nr:HlyC/CorC family transporter [Bacteroidota bacterium]
MNASLIILFALLFSAFFSGMEMAYQSAGMLRITLARKQRRFYARFMSGLYNRSAHFMITLLIGKFIALAVYGIFMLVWLGPPLREHIESGILVLLVLIILSSVLYLLAGELLPILFFRARPNIAMQVFALPTWLIFILFYPVTLLFILLGRFISKYVFHTDFHLRQQQLTFGRPELSYLVKESQSPEGEEQASHDFKILRNVLDFAEVRIRDCMIPRPEIIAVEEKTGTRGLQQIFNETGLSKILVYKDSIDNITGYVNVKDLFRNPKTIKSKITPISIVPESMPANKLLAGLMKEKKSIAVVVDEFGGISGLVTVEDILEEIFGEIEDEHDFIRLVEKQINDREYIFSGRLEIDYLNEKYQLGIPETDDYDTIAGFILYHYEDIPTLNETILIDRYEFKILKVSRTRLELVKLILHDQ